MVASHLCFQCVPEGTVLMEILNGRDLTTGPPEHCNGRGDTTRDGLIGGYRCSCECNRRKE